MFFKEILLLAMANYFICGRCLPMDFIHGESYTKNNDGAIKLAQYVKFKESLNLPKPGLDEQLQLLAGKSGASTWNNTQEVIDPKKIGFFVYSKKKPTVPIQIFVNDFNSLKNAGYNKNYKTKFIVHGFMNSLTSEMIQDIKNNLLSLTNENVNIIAVDWSAYALFYVEVHKKALAVGGIIANFMNYLTQVGTQLKDIHCIGHSLGAHTCGFAGNKVKGGLIGRISGLDPALPGFKVDDISGRLSTDDAEFVDCIHTCGGFLGMLEPICHADFYPNSGNFQPGCPWIDAGSCNHGRSHQFYAESILPGHTFPSLNCESLDFTADGCTYKGALMGYRATEKYTGILYTTTRESYPFALNSTSEEI